MAIVSRKAGSTSSEERLSEFHAAAGSHKRNAYEVRSKISKSHQDDVSLHVHRTYSNGWQ